MKLQHLRFFVAVVEFGSVTRAAERLHVSQPAISAGLKALEQEVGEPLFRRSGGRRRIVPTPGALQFQEKANDILARCDAALAVFRRADAKKPLVRIGVLRTIAAETVVAATTGLARATEMLWRVREGSAEELIRWLRQGRIDIAWTTGDSKMRNTRVLWREPFVVIAARNHPVARRRRSPVTLHDLANERLILRASCELKAGALRSAGIRMPIVARAERDEVALRLAAARVGVLIAPSSLVVEGTVAIPIEELSLDRTIVLRWRHDLPEAIFDAAWAAIMAARRDI